MNLKTITNLWKSNLLSNAWFFRDWQSFVRLHFLHAATESGLLQALSTPSSKEQLIQRLQVQRPEILEALLELGIALGELSHSRGLYRVKGKRSQALMANTGDPFVAFIQEHVTYYNSVYRHAAERLRGAPSGDYLGEFASLVARASKAAEPLVLDFARSTVSGEGPIRVLDVGCGSGIYLRSVAEANPEATGFGLDMEEAVVEQAMANLEDWGISDRFQAIVGDIQNPPTDLVGPFDLITLYNIIYYFPVADRPTLFRSLRSMLSANGVIAMTSTVQGKGKDVWAANLDLATRSTVGCAPLPDPDELTAQLEESGFGNIKNARLMPGAALYGIVATVDARD
jgi:cyclopropane fatty-acyl-phospholipid synthase-like methyltransferase